MAEDGKFFRARVLRLLLFQYPPEIQCTVFYNCVAWVYACFIKNYSVQRDHPTPSELLLPLEVHFNAWKQTEVKGQMVGTYTNAR
jgi:hypothetical protein